MAVAVTTLLLTLGLVGGGHVDFVFFPKVESDFISASVTMPLETPVEVTEEAVRVLEQSGLRLQREIEGELGSGVIRHVLTSVGDQPFATIAQRNVGNWGKLPGGAASWRGGDRIDPFPGAVVVELRSDAPLA